MMKYIIILFSIFINFSLAAQIENERIEKMEVDGEIVTMLITETNDTIFIADLDDVSVSTPRKFANQEEYRRFLKYRRYANKVYPYAQKAIRIFRESEQVTQTLSRRKRKKHFKRLQKELEEEFEEPLKHLTKLQGKILVKMIENELNTPFYTLLKNLRGTFVASYWNTFAYMYGYRLKRGYVKGDDDILDAVLEDYDVSFEVNNN